MIRIRDIKIPYYEDQKGSIINDTAKILCLDKIYPGNSYPDYSFEILRKSIDARKKPEILLVYTVKLLIGQEDEKRIRTFFTSKKNDKRIQRSYERISFDTPCEYEIPHHGEEDLDINPVVIGTGPAGLFCALLLARAGFAPLVIERGQSVDERKKTVELFLKTGKLSYESNVQFGEGGAGTFSDGKLNTLTKDINGRNTFVLKTFAEHGAGSAVLTDAKPHIGTDILGEVVKNIRKEIISLGGKVVFNTKLTDIAISGKRLCSLTLTDVMTGEVKTIPATVCILCTGHSARDTFEMLYERGIKMRPKDFAVGFRVIHPQKLVNDWAYGMEDPVSVGLPAADYKVANETGSGRRVYSFCMCPGGHVINASSEEGRMCVNGMSYSKRDGDYANSAIIAAVSAPEFDRETDHAPHPLAGMYYQRRLEEEAFRRGGGRIPVQSFSDFETGSSGKEEDIEGAVMGESISASLRGIFSDDIEKAIIESMHKFGYTRKGFDTEATLAGIETRTSSPVRIERGSDLECDIAGLYPCGEGAGYAGGIMSAASDGIRCAEMIIKKYDPAGLKESR